MLRTCSWLSFFYSQRRTVAHRIHRLLVGLPPLRRLVDVLLALGFVKISLNAFCISCSQSWEYWVHRFIYCNLLGSTWWRGIRNSLVDPWNICCLEELAYWSLTYFKWSCTHVLHLARSFFSHDSLTFYNWDFEYVNGETFFIRLLG